MKYNRRYIHLGPKPVLRPLRCQNLSRRHLKVGLWVKLERGRSASTGAVGEQRDPAHTRPQPGRRGGASEPIC